MSCTPSKHDLAAFFGSSESRSSKTSSVNVDVSHRTNGLLRESFIKSNQSLIMKIHQLEAKIRNSNKTIDELREENALLKKKLCDRENMDDSDLVDALIEERIKRKLHKLRIISTRTITYLQKAALNLKEAVEDFGLVLAPEAETLSHGDIKPTTLKVCESPPLLCTSKQLENCANAEENCEVSPESVTLKGAQYSKKKSRRNKSLRFRASGKESDDMLLQPSAKFSYSDGVLLATQESSAFSTSHVSETPKNPWSESDAPKPYANENSLEDECETTNQMKMLETTQCIRRKRTAALKIKTMTEPKLNSKLRRPCRRDEPHPFISSLY